MKENQKDIFYTSFQTYLLQFIVWPRFCFKQVKINIAQNVQNLEVGSKYTYYYEIIQRSVECNFWRTFERGVWLNLNSEGDEYVGDDEGDYEDEEHVEEVGHVVAGAPRLPELYFQKECSY